MGKAIVTRNALLDAARRVIGKKGYSGTSVDSIAREAGVSKGMVYYHFRTKADIATSVLLEGLQALEKSFQEQIEASANAREALHAMLHTFTSMIFQNPDYSRFVLNELWRDERDWSDMMHAQGEAVLDIIEGQLKRAVEEGAARADMDTRFHAVGILGTVLVSAQYYLVEGSEQQIEAFEAHVSDYISHAIAA